MSFSNNEAVELFLQQYYTTLIKTPTSVNNFYAEAAQVTVARENEAQKTYTRDFDRVISNGMRNILERVLIVSIDLHEVSNHVLLNVICQYVTTDQQIGRFVESFCIEKTTNHILSSIIRILDEDIVFMKEEKKRENGGPIILPVVGDVKNCVCVMNGYKYGRREVIDRFGRFGKIVGYERMEGEDQDAFIEYDTYHGIEKIKAEMSKEKGLPFNFERTYPGKRK